MFLSLLRLWTGPLPKEELFPVDRQVNMLLHWLWHPIKRHTARLYLKLLQKLFHLQVVAVGGSNGKTTTISLLKCLLPNSIVTTKPNVTSTYNIPSSIFRLRPWTKYFLCEMSIEYPGDMDFYLWLAKPDLAILTLIDVEHTHFLGSIENVAREELKILRGKWPKIVNGNSPQIPFKNYTNCSTFGTSSTFDCFITSARLTPELTTKIELVLGTWNVEYIVPALGEHLAHPLAATVLAAHKLFPKLEFGSWNVGFAKYSPPPHRLQVVKAKSGALILDDSYNANPSSTAAAIHTASQVSQLTKRDLVIIISQMNELGALETSQHQKLAELIKKSPATQVYSVGPATRHIGHHFETSAELLAFLKKTTFSERHVILIKASRSWHLEDAVTLLAE